MLTQEYRYQFVRPAICTQMFHGVPHCPPVRQVKQKEDSIQWGVDVKVSYVFRGWVGVTAGYWVPFDDPLGGALILGVTIIM